MGQNRSALAPFKPLDQTFMSLNKVSMEALLATWVGGVYGGSFKACNV